MLLTRVLFLVAAVLAAPRDEVVGRETIDPYRIPFTVKDENPIHFEDNLPTSLKQGKEYTPTTQHSRPENIPHRPANVNKHTENQRPVYDQQTINTNNQRPSFNYDQSNSQVNQNLPTFDQQRPNTNYNQQTNQGQFPTFTQQRPNTNYDQQTVQGQLPTYDQQRPNTNYDQQTNQGQFPPFTQQRPNTNYDQQTVQGQLPIYNQQRPNTNYDQQTVQGQLPIYNQQRPNTNYDQQTVQGQLPAYNQQKPNTNYDQQTTYEYEKPSNANNFASSSNNAQPNLGTQYNGISLSNNATPPYVKEPSRTRPVLKAEEVDGYAYGTRTERVVRYDGAQVWNVDINSESKLRVVGELSRNSDLASWGGNHESADFMIKPEKLDKVGGVLRTAGIRFNIVIDDLQRYIDEENPQISDDDLQDRKARAYALWNTYRTKGHLAMPVMKPANRRMAMLGAYLGYNSLDDHMEYWPFANWGHRMTWKQYHRLADIHGFLDYLANTYPSICSVRSIGKSNEGRDLKMLRISNGNPSNKAVLIDGGIHAREWISPATVTYIINEIVENYDGESNTFRNLDWYIIPVLNPDGYEYTHTIDRLWRKNRSGSYLPCGGIDLNRNFGYKWGGKGTSKNPCSEIYAGSGPFSEPESRALRDFVTSSNANFKLYVTYHSYGEYILYPWGYENAVPEDYTDLDRVAKNAAQAIVAAGGNKYTVGASSIVLYPAAGGSDDWAKALPKIKYTYTMELSDTGRYGFLLPASHIIKVGKQSLAALRVLADAAIQA